MGLFGARRHSAFEHQTLRLLRLIAHRLEITMADIDTLNAEVAELAADEASIANDVKIVLDELKAQQTGNTPPDLSGAIAALETLHAKLQTDDAALVAAEPAPVTPVTPPAPVEPPVVEPPVAVAPVDATPVATAPEPVTPVATEPATPDPAPAA